MLVAEKVVTTGEKLRRAREDQYPRLTQRDVARLLGIKEERYRSYEYDRARLPEAVAHDLATRWKIPLDWFFDGSDTPMSSESRIVREIGSALYPVQGATVEIPLSSPVPGGDWLAPEESTNFYEIPVRLFKKGRWASPIVGDSNFPYLQQGDVVIWEPKPHPQIGRIILAQNAQSEVTVKQLKYGDSGHVLIGLRDGEELRAPKWTALAMMIARIREPGPGRYSEVSNEGGLMLEELV